MPEDRPLAEQRGYDEATATIVEGSLEDALGVDFV
jgi:hypothetical protein